MGLIEKILSYFGYIRKDKAEETIRYLKSQLALRESELTTMKEDYDDVCDRLTDANTRLVSLNADTIESVKAENDKLRTQIDKVNADIAEAEKFYKEVQKQISEIAGTGEEYKFKYNIEFPGATTIKSANLLENGHVKVSGRTILMDDTTAKIQAATSLREKYTIGLNYLIKTGLLNRLTQNLIQSGALQFTYGYTESTTIEVYYTIEAIVPDSYMIETENKDAG